MVILIRLFADVHELGKIRGDSFLCCLLNNFVALFVCHLVSIVIACGEIHMKTNVVDSKVCVYDSTISNRIQLHVSQTDSQTSVSECNNLQICS